MEAFADGRATLQPATLDKLVSFLWSGLFVLDHDKNLLRSKMSQQPVALGVLPDKAEGAKAHGDPTTAKGLSAQCVSLKMDPDRDNARRIGAFMKGAISGSHL